MAYFDFSSAMFPDTEKVDAAVDYYSRIGQIHVEPGGDTPFQVVSRIVQVAPNVVGSFSVSTCQATRSHSHAAAGNPYDVLGIILNESEVEVAQSGRRAFRYQQGEAFLWRGDQAGICDYLAPSTQLLNIALPRAVLERALPNLDAAAGRRIPASPELRMLTTYAGAFLAEYPEIGSETARVFADHIQDLALIVLKAGRDETEIARARGVRAARLQSIKADIEAHLFDQELSCSWLLGRHRISERYLRMLFTDAGTSFSEYVQKSRLAHAHRRIVDPHQRRIQISTIAFEAGFNDLRWFNRIFRRHFGMTPSEARMHPVQSLHEGAG